MKETVIYRGIYVLVGVIFALLITQSDLTERTQMWVLVAYIVGGIIVTELLRKKTYKRRDEATNQKENAQP